LTATLQTRKEFLPCQGLSWPGDRTIGALRDERQILTSMELRVSHVTSYARAPSSLLFLRSARYPRMPRFLQFLREFWPRPHPLMYHSLLALFAQRTHVPTSSRSIGFCVIWVCISSSSSSSSSTFTYRAGINISTQIKNSVYNVVWGDLDKKRCFKHPRAAEILMRPSFPGK